MKNIIRNADGEIIRFESQKLGISCYRPQYTSLHGAHRRAARFYCAKMINRKLARFQLSPKPEDADKLADEIAAFFMDPRNTLEAAQRKFNPNAIARGARFSTIGELIHAYSRFRAVLGVSERTADGYRAALLLLLRKVEAYRKGHEFQPWPAFEDHSELAAPWLCMTLDCLTEAMAQDYQKAALIGELDEEEELSARISADTVLRGARGFFSKEAAKMYANDYSLSLPDLSGFLAVGLFNAKKYFVLPRIETIRAIFEAAAALRIEDLNAYRAFLLCAHCGMRKGEAASFSGAWLQDACETPFIEIKTAGEFNPKHGHGRTVQIEAWVAREIRLLTPSENEAGYFIDGSDFERTSAVFERLNGWLRGLGVDATKPTHELRKLWFSQKAKREGTDVAAEQGGHRDPKVTASFYKSSLLPDNVLAFWREPRIAALAQ